MCTPDRVHMSTLWILQPALADTIAYLNPYQLANSIAAGIDSIVHNIRIRVKRFGRDENHVMVAIHATNIFNTFCKEQIWDLIPEKAPSLTDVLNMIYERQCLPLIISLSSTSPCTIQSKEGMEKGDPVSTL